jgi:hypothetical protein
MIKIRDRKDDLLAAQRERDARLVLAREGHRSGGDHPLRARVPRGLHLCTVRAHPDVINFRRRRHMLRR